MEAGERECLKIDRVEVIEEVAALNALVSPIKGKEYDYNEVADSKRIIGAEVQLAMGKAGMPVERSFVRAWIDGIPYLTRRKSPQSQEGLLGGGLMSIDKNGTVNLVMVEIFGKVWYFKNRLANISDNNGPENEISKTEFMNMVWRPQ
jgi:hypothetical protein